MKGKITVELINEKKTVIITLLWFLSAVVFVSYFYPVYRDIKKAEQDLMTLEGNEIKMNDGVEQDEEEHFFWDEADVLFQRLENILLKSTALDTSTLHLENIDFPQDSKFGWMVIAVDFSTSTQGLPVFIGEVQNFCPCIRIESLHVRREEELYAGRIRVKTCFLNSIF